MKYTIELGDGTPLKAMSLREVAERFMSAKGIAWERYGRIDIKYGPYYGEEGKVLGICLLSENDNPFGRKWFVDLEFLLHINEIREVIPEAVCFATEEGGADCLLCIEHSERGSL